MTRHLTFRIETPHKMFTLKEASDMDNVLDVTILNGGREVGTMKLSQVKLKYLPRPKDSVAPEGRGGGV